jgi:dolichol-phosphate mannosyltransferase
MSSLVDTEPADTGRTLMDAGLTIVIAAKNEAQTVGEIVTHARRLADQVIVVDGHSTDDTRKIARCCGADTLSDGGRGKGDAIRTAIPYIRGDVTVFVDADGSHALCDIPRLIEPIRRGEADHVTASRLLGGSSELHGGFDEFLRLSGSSFITACINWRFGVRLSDSQNGFRAIRTEALAKLGLRENLTTIEQEMIIKTLKLGLRMGEVPSHEHPRVHGRSHIRLWRSGPRYVYSLIRDLYF